MLHFLYRRSVSELSENEGQGIGRTVGSLLADALSRAEPEVEH